MMNYYEIAQKVFQIEAEQIKNLSHLLTADFEKAIVVFEKCKGKVIVCGMGKSGIIGKKIAATLASTGTPSFFLHPGEAYHGDLGMVTADDVLLLISNSGETDEVLRLIPFLKNQKNVVVAMTGHKNSTLARNSDFHLNIAVAKEACPLQLAPTSSTTATLVMGDAIAVALMEIKKFKAENFARFHPGGSLGRKLLTKVQDLMHTKNLPIIIKNTCAKDVIQSVTAGKRGLAVVVENQQILGVITDGDLRRNIEKDPTNFFDKTAKDLMTVSPKTIVQTATLNTAEKMMVDAQISALLVINDRGVFVGVIEVFDVG